MFIKSKIIKVSFLTHTIFIECELKRENLPTLSQVSNEIWISPDINRLFTVTYNCVVSFILNSSNEFTHELYMVFIKET